MDPRVLTVFYAALAAYAGLVLLVTPKGRRWMAQAWAGPRGHHARTRLRRRFVRPERSDGFAESLLRAQRPRVAAAILHSPLAIVALAGAWLFVSDLRFHLPLGILFLMLLGRRITWLVEETPAVNRILQGSLWMNSQRMINDSQRRPQGGRRKGHGGADGDDPAAQEPDR